MIIITTCADHYMKSLINFSQLSVTDFCELANEIITIFPKERRETYYIPPVPKKYLNTEISEYARGRLVDKFHNKLQCYRRMTGYKKKSNDNSTENRDEITETIGKLIDYTLGNAIQHRFFPI